MDRNKMNQLMYWWSSKREHGSNVDW